MKFASLRKVIKTSALKIGFVPLIDCAPLVLAKELGYFQELGVDVHLVREPGWASIRDKVTYGELDGAHALAGLCFAISWGLGVLARPCVTGFLFNSHGDAITVASNLVPQEGASSHQVLQHMRSLRDQRLLQFGIPHRYSSHHFLLRHWLRTGGLDPERDVEIVSLPPSQMNACLEAGYLDGFCVGEPFNTQALDTRHGSVVSTSLDLVPLHPEKALLVPESLAEKSPNEHRALIRGLVRACAVCDTLEGRLKAARFLADRRYLNMDEEILRASLIADRPEFHLFSGSEINAPSIEKANWLVSQMRTANLLGDREGKPKLDVTRVFRADLFEEAA